MTKLIAIENQLPDTLSFANRECAADARLIPPGLILTLGQYNQGVDIPAHRRTPDRGNHVLVVSGTAQGKAFSLAFCMDGNTFVGLEIDNGIIDNLTEKPGEGDGIRLIIDASGYPSYAPMSMPALETPRLVGIENGLPYYLRFTNHETPGDDVLYVPPGTLTPVTGQYNQGAEIPSCTESEWPNSYMLCAGDPQTLTLRLFRQGYDIYYSIGADDHYPGRLSPVPGGYSQGFGKPKYLTIRSATDITMQEAPVGFGSTDAWINDPLPLDGKPEIHAETELMTNHRVGAGGAIEDFHSFVTRIAVRDEHNAPIPGAKLELLASQPVDVDINGKRVSFGGPKAAPVPVETNLTGQLVITQQAISLGSPVYRVVKIEKPDGTLISSDLVDVHPADKPGAKLAGLKTEGDWAKQRSSNGGVLFPDKSVVERGAGAVDLMLATAHETFDDATTPFTTAAAVRLRGVARRRPATRALGSLPNLSRLEGRSWGMGVAADGSHVTLSAAETRTRLDAVRATATAADGEQSFWDWLVDKWNRLKNFFLEVVNGVATFIIEVAEATWKFAVTLVSEIFDAIGWVLQKVFGLTAEKIIDWLGTLFDWTDIQRTYGVLRSLVNTAPERFLQGLLAVPAQAQALLARLTEKPDLTKFAEHAPIMNGSSSQAMAGHRDVYSSSPALDWTGDAVANNFEAATSNAPSLSDTISALLQNLFAEGEAIWELFKSAFADVTERFETLTLSQIVDKILGALSAAAQRLLNLLASAATAAGQAIAAVVRTILDSIWEVPLVSGLFHKFVDPKRPSTLGNLCCMLLAIPTTVLFKQLTHRAPFSPEPTATATATAAADPVLSSKDQIVMAMVTCACQSFSTVLYGVVEANRIVPLPVGPDKPFIKKLLAFKLIFDVTGYILSVFATSDYFNTLRHKPTPREVLDEFLATWQVVYRAKDVARLATFDHPMSAYYCGLAESLCSVVHLGATFSDIAQQANEDWRQAIPTETQGQFAQLVLTKAVQLLCLGSFQALSWPREYVRDQVKTAEALVIAQPHNNFAKAAAAKAIATELALLKARVVLSAIVPVAGVWRGVVNYQIGRRQSVIS